MEDLRLAEAWLAGLSGLVAWVAPSGEVAATSPSWAEVDCPLARLDPCGDERILLGGAGEHRCSVTGRVWRWRAPSVASGGHLVELAEVTGGGPSRGEGEGKFADQLRDNDRMAGLGRLVASLAHEVNNPLGYVIGNLDLLTRDLARLEPPARDRAYNALTMAKEGALRVRDIIRDLQTLSRAQRTGAVKLLDPAEVIQPALRMLEGQLTDRARVEVALEEVPILRASPSQLTQVVLNLLTYVRSWVAAGDPDRQCVHVRASTGERGAVCFSVSYEAQAGLSVAERRELGDPDVALGIARTIVAELDGSIDVEVEAPLVRVEVRLPGAAVEER